MTVYSYVSVIVYEDLTCNDKRNGFFGHRRDAVVGWAVEKKLSRFGDVDKEGDVNNDCPVREFFLQATFGRHAINNWKVFPNKRQEIISS